MRLIQLQKKRWSSKNIGGKSGGGTVLTEYGNSLINTFEKINESCWRHLDKEIKKVI